MQKIINKQMLLILAGTLLMINPGNAQNWNQIIKTVASDRGTNDQFGYSVAISGDFAIVGAYKESEDANGANTKSEAGSAYIFKKTAGVWAQQQKIVASDRASGDWFGYSVAISGDFAIIGAYQEDEDASGTNTLSAAGSAYIFKQTAGVWAQQKKIIASDRNTDDEFGFSVAISGDFAIVGAHWEDEDVSGANNLSAAGSAYVFKQTAGVWAQQQKIVATDRATDDQFGTKVAISGDFAIIGAPNEDEDANGGNTLSYAGSAYIFKQTSGVWAQQQKIVAADRATLDFWGSSLDINGDYAIIGASNEDEDASGANKLSNAGSAYIFKQTSGVWQQQKKIVASDRALNDGFGIRVAMGNDYAIVGASLEDHDASGANLLDAPGSAYIFKQTSGVWAQLQKIVATDRAASDNFGSSVAISGDYAIVGAPNEDEDANGANTLSAAGSNYIFKMCINTTGTDKKTACNSFKWIDGTTYTVSNNTATFKIVGGNKGGCDSTVTLNLTINKSTTGTDVKTACNSYKWIDGKIYMANNNTATFTLVGGNKAGCDSIITLNLTINTVSNILVTKTGATLTASLAGASYQWLDCDKSYSIIAGKNSQSFTPAATGNYAVKITQNSCSDTSICYNVKLGKIENTFEQAVLIYPNPTNGIITIDLGYNFQNTEITLRDIMGRLIGQYNHINKQTFEIDVPGPSGIYFLNVQAGDKMAVLRLTKN